MALGNYDRLCAVCNTRLGIHIIDPAAGAFVYDKEYHCPTRHSNGRWMFDLRLGFVDSNKKRSTYCDRRNNPGLYRF